MILRLAHIVIFLIVATSAFTQDKQADSLRGVIVNSTNKQELLSAYKALAEKVSNTRFDETIALCNQGIALAKTENDSVSIGHLQASKGRAYYFKGAYDSAAVYYYSAIKILETKKEPRQLALTLNELAKLYRKTRDLKRANEKYQQAFNIFQNLKDSSGISIILNEWGVVFEYEENYKEAIRKYQGSLDICKARNDQLGVSYALSNLAGVYTILEKYKEAEQNFLEALAIRQQLKDSFALALTYSDIGSMYQAKKDYQKATESLQASNAIASAISYLELRSNNFKVLSGIAKEQGNYQQAYQYMQQHIAIKDSVFRLDAAKQVEELSTKYETEKKEQQIKIQEYELQQKNIFLTIAIILSAVIALLSYLLYNRYRLKQQARLQKEILHQQELATKGVIEAEENERKRIASDLHDGVGQMMSAAKMNLSAIEDEIPFSSANQKQAFEKAISLVDESCKEVRTVSHNMMPNALLKSGLASAIREFIDKIDSRVIKVDLYTEGLNDHIDSNIETVLYRVVQECVNNVIKHSGAHHLDISLIRDDDGISVTIEDNGKGFDTSDRSKFDGIGLKNIQARIGYLKGTVDFDSSLGKGTLVAIHVPVIY